MENEKTNLAETAKIFETPLGLNNFISAPTRKFLDFNTQLTKALIENANLGLPKSIIHMPELTKALQLLDKLPKTYSVFSETIIPFQSYKIQYLTDFIKNEALNLSIRNVSLSFTKQEPNKKKEEPSQQNSSNNQIDTLVNNVAITNIPKPVLDLLFKFNHEIASLQKEVQDLYEVIQHLKQSDIRKTQMYNEINLKIDQEVHRLEASEFFNPTELVDKNEIMKIFNISESTYYRHRDNWLGIKVGAKSLYNLAIVEKQSRYFLK
jgi:hypothetical protein